MSNVNHDDHQPAPSLTEQQQRRPLVELLLLAAPTIAQMSSYTLMQSATRWLLPQVGAPEAAAAGPAGLTSFSVVGFGSGSLLAVTARTSKAFGRKKDEAAE